MIARVLLHAPTPDALRRARSNARNILAADPAAEIEIVVNAGAVTQALDDADPQTDPLIRLCRNSLRALHRDNAGFRTVPVAILYIVERQADGWAYIRT